MKKVIITILLGTMALFSATAKEILQEWDYKDQKNITLSFSPGNRAIMQPQEQIQTPDKRNVLAVTLEELASGAVPWDVQLRFLYRDGLKAGQKYEISFYCRSTVPETLRMEIAMDGKPWTSLPGGGYSVNVTKKWKLVKFQFSTKNSWKSLMAMPRFMLANCQRGVLFFGPVTLTQVSEPLALSLDQTWKLFTGLGKEIPTDRMPGSDSVLDKKAKLWEVKAIGNNLDVNIAELAGRFEKEECAWLFNRFDSRKVGNMHLGFSADWWLELYVNGRKVYSNLPQGNGTHNYTVEDHVIDLPVKQGENLLAAKVLSGSAGWRFLCGESSREPDSPDIYTVRVGPDWKAINMAKLQVKCGTALDLTNLNGPRTPAGTFGRLTVNRNGYPIFEQRPNHPVRFFAFNFMPYSWRLKAHLWAKKDIDDFVSTVARQGYNMIRLHGNDRFLLGWKVNERPLKRIVEEEIPKDADMIEFDPGNLDRFDYLVAKLKENGIYINLDLMTSSTGYTMAHPRLIPKEDSFQLKLFTSPSCRKHWKAAVSFLLNHRNPYTGLRLKDDPVLCIVEPYNEQDLLIYDPLVMKVFSPGFRNFLEKKYHTVESLQKAWNSDRVSFSDLPNIDDAMLRRGDIAAGDAGMFLTETMEEMTRFYFNAVRDAGYPGIVTQWDMIMRTMEIPVRALLPVIAQHVYFAHPGFGRPTKHLVKKSPIWSRVAGNSEFDVSCNQDSSLHSGFFRAAAAARFLNRPFMITEYSHSPFNRYRHERGLFFGSYAALQGWSCLTAHGHTVAIKDTTYEPFSWFENALDPISRASETATAFAYLREDVSEAPHSVELKIDSQMLFPKHLLAAVGDDYAKLAMLTKIGIAYPQVKPLMPVGTVTPDLELSPAFSPLSARSWYLTNTSGEKNVFSKLLILLKRKKVIDGNNRTDCSRYTYQSETGEIILNEKTNTMSVTTPRLEGAIIKKDCSVDLSRLRISSCSQSAAVVLTSLDRDKTLPETGRMLLIFSTDAANSNMTFENSSCTLVAGIGTLPVLMKTAKLEMTVKIRPNTTPAVYALNLDGTREEPVPCEFHNGNLILKLDTSSLKYATPFFEIILDTGN